MKRTLPNEKGNKFSESLLNWEPNETWFKLSVDEQWNWSDWSESCNRIWKMASEHMRQADHIEICVFGLARLFVAAKEVSAQPKMLYSK